MAITEGLCPCMEIEEGLINDCDDCPYTPVNGENETFERKEVVMKDLINSIEITLCQLLTDIPYKDLSKKEIKEVLVELLVVIREFDK